MTRNLGHVRAPNAATLRKESHVTPHNMETLLRKQIYNPAYLLSPVHSPKCSLTAETQTVLRKLSASMS